MSYILDYQIKQQRNPLFTPLLSTFRLYRYISPLFSCFSYPVEQSSGLSYPPMHLPVASGSSTATRDRECLRGRKILECGTCPKDCLSQIGGDFEAWTERQSLKDFKNGLGGKIDGVEQFDVQLQEMDRLELVEKDWAQISFQ